MIDYSSQQINKKLIEEITEALKNIRGWGSVEIFVQDFKVVQIIERNIKKTVGTSITKKTNETARVK